MDNIVYRKLKLNEIDQLAEFRICQLQEEGAEVKSDIKPFLTDYFKRHIEDGTFVSWVAVCNGEIVATSGISFIERPPYYGNISGRAGILSSMYTLKPYRRRGIAKKLLSSVTEEAKKYGCGEIQVSASNMGAMLYRNFGFIKNDNFFQLQV